MNIEQHKSAMPSNLFMVSLPPWEASRLEATARAVLGRDGSFPDDPVRRSLHNLKDKKMTHEPETAKQPGLPPDGKDLSAGRTGLTPDFCRLKDPGPIQRITKRDWPTLFEISRRIGPQKIAENSALIGVAIAIVSLGSWPFDVLGSIAVGLGGARNLELTHETLHYTLFRSRRINRLIGTILATPMGVSWRFWHFTHMQHHDDVRLEGFSYQLERLAAPIDWIRHALMLAHWQDVLRRAWMAVRWDRDAMHRELGRAANVDLAKIPDRVVRGALCDYLLVAACFGVTVGVLSIYSAAIPIVLGIHLVTAVIHTAIELPEHLETDVASDDGLRNSRYIQANRFLSWIVNDNNRHAHHHWVDNAPVGNLWMLDHIVEKRGAFVSNYPTFFRDIFAGAWRRWSSSRKHRLT
jgi:fatty acid desaturase